jgi:hypothetical protein
LAATERRKQISDDVIAQVAHARPELVVDQRRRGRLGTGHDAKSILAWLLVLGLRRKVGADSAPRTGSRMIEALAIIGL